MPIPKVLQIDSISVNRNQIKTIFAAKCPDNEYEKFTPDTNEFRKFRGAGSSIFKLIVMVLA